MCQLLHDPVEVEVGIDPVSLLQLRPDPASLVFHARSMAQNYGASSSVVETATAPDSAESIYLLGPPGPSRTDGEGAEYRPRPAIGARSNSPKADVLCA